VKRLSSVILTLSPSAKGMSLSEIRVESASGMKITLAEGPARYKTVLSPESW
jgi:hypothetical protein